MTFDREAADRIFRESARLAMLKMLAEETDETLPSDVIEVRLVPFGIRRPRAWVHGELRHLEELGAVNVTAAGTVMGATLTELGRRHLRREIAIEGVKRPLKPEI